MKTILVATDFSNASENAVQYAAGMAACLKADLILFHAYHTPPVVAEFSANHPTLDDIKKEADKELYQLKNEIRLTAGKDLKIECVSQCGFAVDLINEYADDHNVDLVVMGMQGAGKLIETLIGSITTSVIKEGKRPVIVVGAKMKFRVPKEIVLACDYKRINGSVLWPLKDLAKRCESHISILNVSPESEPGSNRHEAACTHKLDHFLSAFNHSYHEVINENVVEGINDFISVNEADLVVMISRKHSFLENLFHGTETKRMAFQGLVPLLALHE